MKIEGKRLGALSVRFNDSTYQRSNAFNELARRWL